MHLPVVEIEVLGDYIESWFDDEEDEYEEDDGYLPEDGYSWVEFDEDDDGNIITATYCDGQDLYIVFGINWYEGEVAITPSKVGPSTDFIALRKASCEVYDALGL